MAIPTPDSLIAVVKPVLDTSDAFLARLGAKMADPTVIKNAYRGSGLFTFYVEGYMLGGAIDSVKAALREAGYQVHRVDQQVGYVPPDYYIDFASVSHTDENVSGTIATPWFVVSVSKSPVT